MANNHKVRGSSPRGTIGLCICAKLRGECMYFNIRARRCGGGGGGGGGGGVCLCLCLCLFFESVDESKNKIQ